MTTIVSAVVVEPVSSGTLRLRSHPAAVAGVAWVIAAVVGMLIAGIAAGNPLRRITEFIATVDESGSDIVPAFLVPALLFLLGLAIALVLAGSQRLRLWRRALLLVTCAAILGALIASSTVVVASGAWIRWTALAALIAYCLLIWTGRTTAAVDFFVLLILTMTVVVLSYRGFVAGSQRIEIRFDLVTTATLLLTLNSLAMPLAFGSGLGATQLGVSIVEQAGFFIARRNSSRIASILLVIVIVRQVIAVVPDFADRWSTRGALDAVGPMVGGALIIGVCLLIWRLAHRSPRSQKVLEPNIAQIASVAALPIGYALMAPLLISTLLGLIGIMLRRSPQTQSAVIGLAQGFSSEITLTVFRVAVVIGLAAAGIRMISHGRSRTAAVLLIDAVMLAVVLFGAPLTRAANLNWAVADLGNIGLLLGIVLFARWAARGILTPDRLVLLYAIVLLSALVRRADYFDLPFGFLINASAFTMMVIGLIWGFLTGGGAAHEDSPHNPRDGKLLFFLGSFLFTIAMVAWSAIGKQVKLAAELSETAALGLLTIGTAYVLLRVLDTAHDWRRADRFRRAAG